MKYLVDTTWTVEYLRDNQDIIQRLQSLRAEGLAISVISVVELFRGVFFLVLYCLSSAIATAGYFTHLFGSADIIAFSVLVCR